MGKPCSQVSEHKEKVVVRRSGNYGASAWDYDSIQSLHNQYSGEKYVKRANELKEQVKAMLGENMQVLDCLELVDALERLGISYHFEAQIDAILNNLNDRPSRESQTDLHATALEFRFLRQHGFHVSQEIFRPFMNEDGDQFDESLVEDIKGMLSLYEASFLSTKDETILDLAKEFTLQNLKKIKVDHHNYLSCLVNHSLYLPLRWRVPRIEARWYIEVNQKNSNMNPILLELAKLDYNIVQASHQQELKHEASWLKDSRIMEKLIFTRSRIVECYFWGVGVVSNPAYSSSRSITTKLGILILVIDDMYDVYGTLEELERFTVAVERWDVGAMDELPEYMKVAFLFLFNTINQIAFRALTERGVHVVKYLRTAWADLCKAYMQEARWYYSGYTPTLEEYLKNAEVSITMQVMAVHEYVYFADPVEMETMEVFESGNPHNIVRWTSLLMRFADDLGTSAGEMERGDVAKTVQCRMKDTGCSEEEARKYVWKCYAETWKDMNDICVHPCKRSPFLTSFARIMQNNATATLALYQLGDGLGLKSNPKTKRYIEELLFSPIPVSPADSQQPQIG